MPKACNIKIDGLEPVRKAAGKNLLPVFDGSNIVELKTIYRVIPIKPVFHGGIIIWN